MKWASWSGKDLGGGGRVYSRGDRKCKGPEAHPQKARKPCDHSKAKAQREETSLKRRIGRITLISARCHKAVISHSTVTENCQMVLHWGYILKRGIFLEDHWPPCGDLTSREQEAMQGLVRSQCSSLHERSWQLRLGLYLNSGHIFKVFFLVQNQGSPKGIFFYSVVHIVWGKLKPRLMRPLLSVTATTLTQCYHPCDRASSLESREHWAVLTTSL